MNSPVRSVVLVCALTLCASVACAQRAPFPARRLYMELHAASQRYAFVYSSGSPHKPTVGPAKVNIGYFVSPRLALQVGILYRTKEINQTSTGTTIAGIPSQTKRKKEEWTTVLPVLARYSLVAVSERLKVDVLGGVTLLQSRFNSTRTTTEGGQVVEDVQSSEKATATYATGGLGLRYALGRKKRLELVSDATISRNTAGLSPSVARYLLIPKWGGTSALSIGMRYNIR
ncbi:outer membrane beta-barrel protein [Hymenobacter weizhouensis]|uniref:outer membrane beta-barrel protein n=1 Tax=Hymenobacter sp. YIM 151500-1 TaxID=2987689 RepID=UPI002226C674|nr:outer membrane beta-barrel protein [Hymenobacter sp. YIM 151500-1]UYZ62350.1 outer membrane beta-barrel protein [Hymenobacter sp. YIM 151500-1]